MRTAIISDLHLGGGHGEDLLRDPGLREVLFEEIGDADRLVLLGDAIELRDLPVGRSMALARPFFEALGEALAGREVVLVPGNHDHRLAEPLLERVAGEGEGGLGAEQAGAAEDGLGASLAGWLGEARLTVAYPGIWIREDVYATHGHYMDCHMSLPRIECLAAAAVMRGLGVGVPSPASPDDYERVLRPIYGFAYALAQGGATRRRRRPSERVWRALNESRSRGRLRGAARRTTIEVGIPAGVGALNRVLRSDFRLDLSAGGISRSGIAAEAELARRLDLGAAHFISGHTHRAGPEPDDPGWQLADGGRFHNTGSWIFASAFHRPGTPPGSYWPGTVTWVEDEGPPRRSRLLDDRSVEQMWETMGRIRKAAGAA